MYLNVPFKRLSTKVVHTQYIILSIDYLNIMSAPGVPGKFEKYCIEEIAMGHLEFTSNYTRGINSLLISDFYCTIAS